MPYQVLQHGDYLEVRLEGVLVDALDFDASDLVSTTNGTRLLLDYTGVTDIQASAYTLAEQARNGESRGFKVAVCAPRPALFGLSRQAFQLSHVREGESAGVFSSLEAARAWLMSG